MLAIANFGAELPDELRSQCWDELVSFSICDEPIYEIVGARGSGRTIKGCYIVAFYACQKQRSLIVSSTSGITEISNRLTMLGLTYEHPYYPFFRTFSDAYASKLYGIEAEYVFVDGLSPTTAITRLLMPGDERVALLRCWRLRRV
jgi:hypothetical protein